MSGEFEERDRKVLQGILEELKMLRKLNEKLYGLFSQYNNDYQRSVEAEGDKIPLTPE